MVKNTNALMITESIFTYYWGFTLNLTASVDVYKQSDQLLTLRYIILVFTSSDNVYKQSDQLLTWRHILVFTASVW